MPRVYQISLGAEEGSVLSSFMADRKSRVSMIMGPLGSGKTYGCIQRLLAQCMEQEPNAQGERLTRWCIIRNTYPDLTSTTMKDFLEVFIEMKRSNSSIVLAVQRDREVMTNPAIDTRVEPADHLIIIAPEAGSVP